MRHFFIILNIVQRLNFDKTNEIDCLNCFEKLFLQYYKPSENIIKTTQKKDAHP